MTGIVPTKASAESGPIEVSDVLVSASWGRPNNFVTRGNLMTPNFLSPVQQAESIVESITRTHCFRYCCRHRLLLRAFGPNVKVFQSSGNLQDPRRSSFFGGCRAPNTIGQPKTPSQIAVGNCVVGFTPTKSSQCRSELGEDHLGFTQNPDFEVGRSEIYQKLSFVAQMAPLSRETVYMKKRQPVRCVLGDDNTVLMKFLRFFTLRVGAKSVLAAIAKHRPPSSLKYSPMLLRSVLLLLCGMCGVASALGQSSNNPDVPGIVPYGTYEGSDFDHIDMASGQLYISIPLYSVPQRGSLSASFSANVTGASAYAANATCSKSECTYQYAQSTRPQVAIGFDQYVFLMNVNPSTNTVFPIQSTITIADFGNGAQQIDSSYKRFYIHKIKDGRGGTHYLGYDPSTNFKTLRAVDGSGYLETLSDPSGYQDGATGPLYDSKGIRYDSTGITDPNGNHITLNASAVTDSVGRNLPLPPDPTTSTAISTSACPNLGNATQPVASAYEWDLPGPSGTTEKYIVCYANIYTLTNFLQRGGESYQNTSPGAANEPPYFNIYTEAGTYETVIQSIVYPDGSAWSFEYDGTQNPSTVAYGDLLKVHLPTGGSISYSYSTYQTCVSSAEGYPKGNPPGVLFQPYSRMVTSRILTQLDGTTQTWVYGYSSAPSGGQQSTVNRPDGNSTVHTYEGLASVGTCNFAETQQNDYQGSAASGKLIGTTQKTYNIFSTPQTMLPYQTTYQWLYSELKGYYLSATVSELPAALTALPSTVTTTTDQQPTSTVTTYNYDSGFTEVQPICTLASPTSSCVWDTTTESYPAVLGRLTGVTITAPDGYGNTLTSKRTTAYQAFNSAGITNSSYYSANLLDLPQTVTVSGTGGNSSTTTFGYDENNGSPMGVLGNQTSVTIAGPQGGSTSSSTVYNALGMPITKIDGMKNQTTYAYADSSSVSPSSITRPSTNGVAHVESYSWDANTGKKLTEKDQNGVSTQYTYGDPDGRISLVDAALGTSSETKTTYSYPTPNSTNVLQDQKTLGDGLEVSSVQLDGFGRVIHSIDLSGNTTDVGYDSMGRKSSVSNPHASTPEPATDGTIYYTYDALGRVTQQENQDKSYQYWCYDGVASSGQPNCVANKSSATTATWVDFTDENGNHRQQVNDGMGRLIAVIELNPSSNSLSLETDYSYDGLGNILNVNQKGTTAETARQRSFSYDSLSRLLTSSNPESGTIGYSYLSSSGALCAGDSSALCSKTDARGVITSYSYDALNRILGKTYSGLNTTAASIAATTLSTCYQYDSSSGSPSGPNFIGRLTNEWTQSGTCSSSPPANSYFSLRAILAYDPMGRVKSEQQCALGSCMQSTPFSLGYNYDLAGNVTQGSNGLNTITWSPTYDSAGRLSAVGATTLWSDPQYPSNLFNANAYGPAGITGWTLGTQNSPSLTLQNTYDSRLRVNGSTVTGHQ